MNERKHIFLFSLLVSLFNLLNCFKVILYANEINIIQARKNKQQL